MKRLDMDITVQRFQWNPLIFNQLVITSRHESTAINYGPLMMCLINRTTEFLFVQALSKIKATSVPAQVKPEW